MKLARDIIIKPVISEKSVDLMQDNRYCFKVAITANKIEIKKAVEELYSVSVTDVNTLRYSGKVKSRFTKAGVITGQGNATKKAIVTLADGNAIDFYSNI